VLYSDDLGTNRVESQTIPAGMEALVKQYRHDLIEAVADYDDAIMHLYLEEKEPSEDQVRTALRRGAVAGATQGRALATCPAS